MKKFTTDHLFICYYYCIYKSIYTCVCVCVCTIILIDFFILFVYLFFAMRFSRENFKKTQTRNNIAGLKYYHNKEKMKLVVDKI